jgi:putative ABC transport system permease protein
MRFALSTVGIAAGVALVYAVASVNEGISSSLAQVERSIAGSAQLQVNARSYAGLSQRAASRITAVPTVQVVAPISETPVRVRAENGGQAAITLLGVSGELTDIGSDLVATAQTWGKFDKPGLYLPAATAGRIGASPGQSVAVDHADQSLRVALRAVLPDKLFAELRGNNLGIAPLPVAQRLAGSDRRASRLLVEVRQGTVAQSRKRIAQVAGPNAVVYRVGQEAALLSEASELQRQAAGLFSTVALIVGALLTYNATLLTLTERRREFAIMRMIGAGSRSLLGGLLSEAAILAIAGIGLGLVVGSMAVAALEPDTDYLSGAFAIIPSHSSSDRPTAIASAAGILAVMAGGLLPGLSLLRVPPVAALHTEDRTQMRGARRIGVWPWALVGFGLAAIGAAVVLLAPAAGMVGIVVLIAGGFVLVRAAVPIFLAAGRRLLRRPAGVARLAWSELYALPKRATAGAAIGAVSILALTLVGGLVRNMEDGTLRLLASSLGHSDLWVTPRGDGNVFLTEPFNAKWIERLDLRPEVDRVGPYRADFLDWAGRRLLAFGLPADTGLGSDELLEGDPPRVAAGLAHGGVVMTQSLARALGVRIGDHLVLPSPRGPAPTHLVGTITNYGWGPGAIGMNAGRFASLWRSDQVTAIEMSVAPGATFEQARRAVTRTLEGSHLKVSTLAQRQKEVQRTARAGTAQLRQIALLVLLAGALGISAAMLTAVLQRRRRLAAMRVLGMSPGQVFGALLAEAGAMVAMGAAVGLVVGIAAQALSAHWITYSTGFPVEFAIAPSVLIQALALTAGAVLLATLWPAFNGARGRISAALEDDQ